MAKPPPPGRCVHCLQEFSVLTWDHVFPLAWYSEATPPSGEKWKIPSCQPCNAAHGKSENDLLVRLGLCLDPSHPSTAPITAKALRALTGRAASNPKDAAARDAKRLKIFKQVETVRAIGIPSESIYPGFGPTSEDDDPHIAIPVPKRALEALAQKVVRGITYLQEGRFIEPPYTIDFYALTEEVAAEINMLLARHGRIFERGPALVIQRAITEDHISAMYRIEIWSKLRMYAFVADPTRNAVA